MAGKKQGTRRPVRRPHFFKVLLGDFKQRLKIPPNFLKHMPVRSSKKLTLQGPNENTWNVELDKALSGTFLSSGWPKFVKDNSLKEYEFLVFRYDGRMHFTVQIFDKTACEREDVFRTKSRRRPSTSSLEGKAKKARTVKRSSQYVVEHRAIKDEVQEHSEVDVVSPDLLQKHCSGSVQGRYLPSPRLSKRIKTETVSTALSNWVIESSIRQRRGYGLSTGRIATEEQKSKAWKAANSFNSSFPHFVVRISAMNVNKPYMLRLPMSFSRAHLPSRRSNLVLRDPNGKAWVVIYIPSSRNRVCGGWVAFARGNNLEEGDCCVFEHIGHVELHAHIFKAVDNTSPS